MENIEEHFYKVTYDNGNTGPTGQTGMTGQQNPLSNDIYNGNTGPIGHTGPINLKKNNIKDNNTKNYHVCNHVHFLYQ
jgi:hypothetical protein